MTKTMIKDMRCSANWKVWLKSGTAYTVVWKPKRDWGIWNTKQNIWETPQRWKVDSNAQRFMERTMPNKNWWYYGFLLTKGD